MKAFEKKPDSPHRYLRTGPKFGFDHRILNIKLRHVPIVLEFTGISFAWKMFLGGVISLLGTFCLLYLVLKFLKLVLQVLKTNILGGSIDFKRFGEWAGNLRKLFALDVNS